MNIVKARKADASFLIVLTIISFSVTMYFSLFGLDAHHDGVMMKNALDVANGRILYTESISQYGMLVSFIQALFIRVFGEHLWSIHLATTVFYVICYDVTYLICKRFVPRLFALVINLLILLSAPFYFWDFLPWSNVFGLCFLICCLYMILLFIESRKYVYLIFSAVFSAFSYFSKMPIGMVVYLALILLLILFYIISGFHKRWGKYIFVYLISTLLCCSAFFSYLVINHATDMWWEQTVSLAFSFASDQSMNVQNDLQNIDSEMGDKDSLSGSPATVEAILSEPTFFDRVEMLLSGVIGILFSYYFSSRIRVIPIVCILMFVYCFGSLIYYKRRCESDTERIELIELLCFSVFALASWSQYYPVACLRHIFWGAFLMFALVLVGSYRLFNLMTGYILKKEKILAGMISMIAAIAFFAFIHYDTLKVNVVSIYANIAYDSYCVKDSSYPYLQGIRMTEEESAFYTDFEQTLYELQAIYPEKDMVNMSFLNLLSCYSVQNQGCLFSLYGYGPLSHSDALWDEHINRDHPIIFSDVAINPTKYPGYQLYRELTGSHGDVYAVGDQTPAFYIYSGDVDE